MDTHAPLTLRNPWLDICRSLAIACVLLSHGKDFLIPFWPQAAFFKFGGFLGVELFFVLSGYLIGTILIRDVTSTNDNSWLPRFYTRRWWRTLPNYYLFLLINIALWFYGWRISVDGPHWDYALFLQNLWAVHPNFFPEAWSLAVEEIFYFAFPLIIICLKPKLRTRQNLFRLSLLCIALLTLMRLYYVGYANPAWDNGLRKIVLFKIDSIFYGVALACISDHLRQLHHSRLFMLSGLVLIIICSVTTGIHDNAWLDQSWFARTLCFSLTSLGCALFIIGGINTKWPAFFSSITGFTARIAYSAYLVNLIIYTLIMHIWPYTEGTLWHGIGRFVTFIVLTVTGSAFIYYVFERPILKFRDKIVPSVHIAV